MTDRDDHFSRLWKDVAAPSADDLRELARRAAEPPQQASAPTRRRTVRARWTVAAVTVTLLVGSGLGFGLANALTPTSTAGRNVVGFGFLPDPGWRVVQTGGPRPGATTATASRPGVVLTVSSTPRGDPALDEAYPARALPLQLDDAELARRSQLTMRAGVGGYNVDARIAFDQRPTHAMLAAAQAQLNRLVVAAERVTIGVRPAISSPATNQVTVFGTIDSSKAGESVTIQAKDCGASFFRVFAGANTEQGGTWSTFIFPFVTTSLRAVWNGETSAEVVFSQRVFIGLLQQRAARFRLVVSARAARFDGKPATIQTFDQRLGRWNTAKRVLLSDDFYTYFTLRVPKGTRVRAVFPNALAKPCYLGATSPVIRT